MRHVMECRRKHVVRAEFGTPEGDATRIVGIAAVYNTPYEMGEEEWGYRETIAPGAFTFDPDVLSTFNHNADLILGRQSNGTLKLEDSPEGLRLDVAPNLETSHGKDALALVKRRDVKGMSITFAYWGDYGEYEYLEKSDGWDELRILRATLFEAGPVANPAYVTTTAEARSISAIISGRRQREHVSAWLESQAREAERKKRADLDAWLSKVA